MKVFQTEQTPASFRECYCVSISAEGVSRTSIGGGSIFLAASLQPEAAASACRQVTLGVVHDQLAERSYLLRVHMRHNAPHGHLPDEVAQFFKFHLAVLWFQQPVHVRVLNEIEQRFAWSQFLGGTLAKKVDHSHGPGTRSCALAVLFGEFAFERGVMPVHLFRLVQRSAFVLHPGMRFKFLSQLANSDAQFCGVSLLAQQVP